MRAWSDLANKPPLPGLGGQAPSGQKVDRLSTIAFFRACGGLGPITGGQAGPCPPMSIAIRGFGVTASAKKCPRRPASFGPRAAVLPVAHGRVRDERWQANPEKVGTVATGAASYATDAT